MVWAGSGMMLFVIFRWWRKHFAGPSKGGRSTEPERSVINEHNVDAHPGLEGAQLLEPLAALEDAGREGDIALERGAAEGVEADMVVVVAGPARRGDAGEIERPRDAARRGVGGEGGHRLDHALRVALVLDADDAAERRDVDLSLGEGGED